MFRFIIFLFVLASCSAQEKKAFDYITNYKNSQLDSLIMKNPSLLPIQNHKGRTLLQEAVAVGNFNAVKILLKNKASINEVSQSGEIALVIAIENGYYNIVKILVESKADIHAVDSAGLNPIKVAYENQKVSIIRYLLENGANKNDIYSTLSADNTRDVAALGTPFSNTEKESLTYIESSDFKAFQEYVDNTPTLNFTTTDSQGNNMLHYAAAKDNIEILSLIIKKQSSLLQATNKNKETPLMVAIQNNMMENTRKLILEGSSLRAVNKQQQTILHFAAQSDSIEMLNLILNNVSNPNVTDFLEVTPLDIAAGLGNAEMTQRLLENNADSSIPTRDKGYTALHFAVESGNIDTVKTLLKFNAQKDIPNSEGKLPVELAGDMDFQEIKNIL